VQVNATRLWIGIIVIRHLNNSETFQSQQKRIERGGKEEGDRMESDRTAKCPTKIRQSAFLTAFDPMNVLSTN
jgi:hypothetical protein